MTLERYYINLRSDLLEIITGVENADSSLFWDNTTSNYTTRRNLEKLFKSYLNKAKNFGLLVVTRHCECPNPKHVRNLTTNDYGISIPYRGGNYIWGHGQMFQGKRYCACPCTKNAKPTEHWVIDDVIYSKDANIEQCKRLESILYDINEAIDSAEDKKPRSGIREYLLRAVLNINDELLPSPMEQYVRQLIK